MKLCKPQSDMPVNGKTKVCGLIGDPVEHTLSPVIHNSIARIMGHDLIYVPFRVSFGMVKEAVRGAYELNILGLNVTVPHKIEVIGALDGIDEGALKIGAVNTLVRTGSGYKGYNTDFLGLIRAIADDGVDLKGRRVVVLGAGGAARSAVYAAQFAGASEVYVLNRSFDKAEALCHDICGTPLKLDEASRVPGEDLIVIQASSVGLYPDVDSCIIDDPEFYDRIKYGFDLIYSPAETKFMKNVREHGGDSSNGLKMLLFQGIAAYELWNDVEVPADVSSEVCKILAECSARKE